DPLLTRKVGHDDPVKGRVVQAFVRGTVSPAVLEAMGLEVQTVAGDVISVRMPVSAAPQVARLTGVSGVRLAMPIRLYNDLSIPDTKANLKRTQSPPLSGWNGSGVVVGLVDSGIEYQHDDFKNPDGSSRILSIW